METSSPSAAHRCWQEPPHNNANIGTVVSPWPRYFAFSFPHKEDKNPDDVKVSGSRDGDAGVIVQVTESPRDVMNSGVLPLPCIPPWLCHHGLGQKFPV